MARHRHLRNAPVREALIDLRFETPITLDAVDRYVSTIRPSYGATQDLWEAMFSIDTSQVSTPSRRTAVGRRLQAADGQYVLQLRTSGFTLSRLSPYGKWDDLKSEASRLWGILVDQLGEFHIARAAVRYINEIKLQLPIAEFGDYLTCPPRLPEGVPQGLSSFLTRVVVPDAEANCVSVVTQALEGPPSEGPTGSAITVLLDIDVFRSGRCASGDDSIWQALSVLRDQKNRMFFGHLMERTVEMYE